MGKEKMKMDPLVKPEDDGVWWWPDALAVLFS